MAPFAEQYSISFDELNEITEKFEEILDSNEDQDLIYETILDILEAGEKENKRGIDPAEIIEDQKHIIEKICKLQDKYKPEQLNKLRELFTFDLTAEFGGIESSSRKKEYWLKNKLSSKDKDLSWLNLSHVNLNKYSPKLSLKGANLSHSLLKRTKLTHADLQGADLSFARLSNTSLRGTNLSFAKLEGLQFTNTNF